MATSKIEYLQPVVFGTWNHRPLRWRALRTFYDSVLLIADEIIDCQPLNTGIMPGSYLRSSLNRWLNEEFYTAAFSTDEKKQIATTFLPYLDCDLAFPRNIQNNAAGTAEVFCLSARELEDYLPGLFAPERKNASDVGTFPKDSRTWWVRTKEWDRTTAVADPAGKGFLTAAASDSAIGVRPCIWVKCEVCGVQRLTKQRSPQPKPEPIRPTFTKMSCTLCGGNSFAELDGGGVVCSHCGTEYADTIPLSQVAAEVNAKFAENVENYKRFLLEQKQVKDDIWEDNMDGCLFRAMPIVFLPLLPFGLLWISLAQSTKELGEALIIIGFWALLAILGFFIHRSEKRAVESSAGLHLLNYEHSNLIRAFNGRGSGRPRKVEVPHRAAGYPCMNCGSPQTHLREDGSYFCQYCGTLYQDVFDSASATAAAEHASVKLTGKLGRYIREKKELQTELKEARIAVLSPLGLGLLIFVLLSLNPRIQTSLLPWSLGILAASALLSLLLYLLGRKGFEGVRADLKRLDHQYPEFVKIYEQIRLIDEMKV